LERTFDTLEDQFSMTTTAEVDLVEEIPDALIIAFQEQCARIDSPSGVGKLSATRPNALNCSITRLFSGVQTMKSFFTIATLALATALVGCNNNKQDAAAPGAVSGECCTDTGTCCSTAAAPGAVSADSCGSSCSDAAAPGAVSSEACGSASSCSDAAAPGAVSSEACGSASSCSDAAAPGAVSSDDACGSGSGACPFSGQAG
jgi:hypothetical protein